VFRDLFRGGGSILRAAPKRKRQNDGISPARHGRPTTRATIAQSRLGTGSADGLAFVIEAKKLQALSQGVETR